MPDDIDVNYIPGKVEDEIINENAVFMMGKSLYYNLKLVQGSKDRRFLQQTRISKETAGQVKQKKAFLFSLK